jgi:hypothetical protein
MEGRETPGSTVRDVEVLGWTAGTFANGAAFAEWPGALWVLGVLAVLASRARGMGVVGDL